MRDRLRDRSEESGFTLIELTIVVLLIGNLLAIAVPTFLAVRERVSDTAAKSRTDLALDAQTVVLTENFQFGDASAVMAAEPTLEAEDLPALDAPKVKGKVYVKLEDDYVVTLVSRSSSGRCFWSRNVEGRVEYARDDCSAAALAFTSSGW